MKFIVTASVTEIFEIIFTILWISIVLYFVIRIKMYERKEAKKTEKKSKE